MLFLYFTPFSPACKVRLLPGCSTRIQQEKAKKAKRRAKRKAAKAAKAAKADTPMFHTDQDDRFFFIAGYTSGGAPYGVTWDEMGLEPWESIEDL